MCPWILCIVLGGWIVIDPIRRATAKPLRNLLIVHTPPLQDLSDWLEVTHRIEEWAPDIEVRIVNNREFDDGISEWQVTRPSLVFSPHRLLECQPKGGTICAGVNLSKFEQFERLARQGLPVPPTRKLTRDINLDAHYWTSYVVGKPPFGSRGQGVSLVKRQDVSSRYDELTLNGSRDMVIQTYIEHSENGYPTHYRVQTLF